MEDGDVAIERPKFKINFSKDEPVKERPKFKINFSKDEPPKERPKSERVRKYTLAIFLTKAREIHGNRYDYSRVKEEHIKNNTSHIPLSCNTCRYEWQPNIHSHISGNGCPDCSGKRQWTLERFLIRAKEIHGDKYDYSRMKAEDFRGVGSHISLTCNTCGHEWSSTINDHINSKHGCANCSGKLPWTLERFLEKARKIHGDKYDYNKVKETDVKGAFSRIPLTCYTCNYKWSTSINNHINVKSGCNSCYGNLPWTLESFLRRAREIHGDKFDYSKIGESDIKGARSHIPLFCNTCEYEWEPTIDSHINGRDGCPNCSGCLRWTLERFLKKADHLYGDRFDYSEIKETDIKGKESRVTIKCIKHNYVWSPTVHEHINSKRGCPICKSSKGELECIRVLKELDIFFWSQVTLDSLPSRKFDFKFTYNDKPYLIEYDGRQHFEFVDRFHKTEEGLYTGQNIDIIKTQAAINEKINLVRIDFTKIKEVKKHILKAIEQDLPVYYSTPDMYTFISKSIKN